MIEIWLRVEMIQALPSASGASLSHPGSVLTTDVLPVPMTSVQKFQDRGLRGNSGFLLHSELRINDWSVGTMELFEEGRPGKNKLRLSLWTSGGSTVVRCEMNASLVFKGWWKLRQTADGDSQKNMWHQIQHQTEKMCFLRACILFMPTSSLITEPQPEWGLKTPYPSSISKFYLPHSFFPVRPLKRFFSMKKYFNRH